MTAEQVKAALLISGADRKRYGGKLKDELANNYLLGTDHYPDILEKAMRILGNYQNTRIVVPHKVSLDNSGVTFLQHRGQGAG